MATTTAAPAEFQDGGKPVAQPIYLVDVNGNPLGTSNPQSPMLTLDQIRGYIALGQGFRVTTGQTNVTTGSAFLGVQGVTNNLLVNVLIYSILADANAGQSDNRLYTNPGSITTDAGLTTNLLTSIQNQLVGSAITSALSTLNGSPATPTQASPSNAGNQIATLGIPSNATQQCLQNGSVIFLPKGKQNTFAVYLTLATAKGAITIEWVEF